MPLADLLSLCAPDGLVATTPPPAITIYQRDAPSALEAYVYQPVVCMVLQGAKMMRSGDQFVDIGPGDALIVSQHLPVNSRITRASVKEPYLAIVLTLDLTLLRELFAQLSGLRDHDRFDEAIGCTPAEPSWADPLQRYLAMTQDQTALAILGPQLLREVHFRLLTSPAGALLRGLTTTDSAANRISQSIELIRSELAAPLRVPEIAKHIGMSNSAFHSHFKTVTGTTPLQYQKDLRLITAMNLLEHEQFSVASAAYEVGYESPTHFSRDYKRKFGHAPSLAKSSAA